MINSQIVSEIVYISLSLLSLYLSPLSPSLFSPSLSLSCSCSLSLSIAQVRVGRQLASPPEPSSVWGHGLTVGAGAGQCRLSTRARPQ